jgi:hypothetical protein
MSRSIHTILKRSNVTLALGAAALLATTGCDGYELQVGEAESAAGSVDLTGAATPVEEEVLEFAALTTDNTGHLDILILAEDGEVTNRIETEYRSEVGPEASEHSLLFHSEEDAFFVTSRDEGWQSLILRIEWDGSVSEFARPSVNPMYRIDVARDGGIVVAAEYDLVKLDLDGVEVARDHNNEACWVDVVGNSNAFGGPVAADIMGASEEGPILGVWDIEESEPFTDGPFGIGSTSVVGENGSRDKILGQDEAGALWMSGRSGQVSRSDDGESTMVGQVDELFEGAFSVRALESAGPDSVYVLLDGGPASQVGQVHADGTSELLFEYGDTLLNDMVVLP